MNRHRPALPILMLLCAGGALRAQELKMTATYPIPVGVYNKIVTTGDGGLSPADTILNRNAGNTILVPPTNPSGSVGIGVSNPGAALELSLHKGVKIGGAYLSAGPSASNPMALLSTNWYCQGPNCGSVGQGGGTLLGTTGPGAIIEAGDISGPKAVGFFWHSGGAYKVFMSMNANGSLPQVVVPGDILFQADGPLRFGNPGPGKVLTSNAAGYAVWKSPGAVVYQCSGGGAYCVGQLTTLGTQCLAADGSKKECQPVGRLSP